MDTDMHTAPPTDKGVRPRVELTPAAEDLLTRLKGRYGALMFHQSGGCCDGSSPMCHPRGEFRIGGSDVLLGRIAETPFYVSESQFEYWRHTHLTVDVVPGRGSGFSVEAPEGVRFLIRSRLFSKDEIDHLEPVVAGVTALRLPVGRPPRVLSTVHRPRRCPHRRTGGASPTWRAREAATRAGASRGSSGQKPRPYFSRASRVGG